MRTTLTEEIDRTRQSVSQIAIWCMIIGTHQQYGVGAERISRAVAFMDRLRHQYVMAQTGGGAAAKRWLYQQLPAGCPTDFPVPLNRASRNRREDQLRMAANDAAGLAWALWAAALHGGLGFGTQRLEVVRREGIANYRQFNAWCCEDKDWAFDKLRRCAEAATREKMVITDEPDTTTVYLADDGLREEDRRAVRLAVTQMMAEKQRPAGWAVLNQQKLMTNIQNEVQFYDQSRNYQPQGRRG